MTKQNHRNLKTWRCQVETETSKVLPPPPKGKAWGCSENEKPWGEKGGRARGGREVLTLRSCSGQIKWPSCPCSLFTKASERKKSQCALGVFFHHCFDCVPVEPHSACVTPTMPFTLLWSGWFSRLSRFLRSHVLGPFHPSSAMTIFSPDMGKARTRHITSEPLQMGFLEKSIFVLDRGLWDLCLSYVIITGWVARHLQGHFTCKALGKGRREKIWQVAGKSPCRLGYTLLWQTYLYFSFSKLYYNDLSVLFF